MALRQVALQRTDESKVVSIHDNGKRFSAFFMDAVVVAMLSMIVFAAVGAPIFGYYETAGVVEKNAEEVETVANNSHLLSSVDELMPSADGEDAMAYSWVYNKSLDDPSDETDFLYYYECTYKGSAVSAYNAKFSFADNTSLSTEEKSAYALLFAVADANKPIVFSSNYKTLISGYEKKTDSSSNALAAYNTAIDAFKAIYRADWEELGKSDAYLTPYSAYYSANVKISFEAGGAALVSYSLAALLYFVALPFAFKRGRTLAKTALHLEVLSARGKLTTWQIVSRGLLETAEFCGLSAFAPFFFIQLPSILLPIAAMGSLVIYMWEIIPASLMIVLLSGGLALFTKDKTTLHDLATYTEVGDAEVIAANQRALERIAAAKGEGNDE